MDEDEETGIMFSAKELSTRGFFFPCQTSIRGFGSAVWFGLITATSTLRLSESANVFTATSSTSTMSSLLHIAHRIEAAVEAYISVKEHANWELWKAGFEDEKVRREFDQAFIDLISVFN